MVMTKTAKKKMTKADLPMKSTAMKKKYKINLAMI